MNGSLSPDITRIPSGAPPMGGPDVGTLQGIVLLCPWAASSPLAPFSCLSSVLLRTGYTVRDVSMTGRWVKREEEWQRRTEPGGLLDLNEQGLQGPRGKGGWRKVGVQDH